jgi:tRNA pseudouridine13 synthase
MFPHEIPRAWGAPVAEFRIRSTPDDFHVFEIPVTLPQGEGNHVWLQIEKRQLNTDEVARLIAKHADVPPREVSYAGLKDRDAVTQQWFSVNLQGKAHPDWSALNGERLHVLQAQAHPRKLKRGALTGNRFVLILRDVAGNRAAIEQRLQQLQQGGVPNAFGAQRFGRNGSNVARAREVLIGGRRERDRHRLGLMFSTARSWVFNALLAVRIEDQTWNQARPGEVLQLDGRSAVFVAEAIDTEIQRRMDALEVHPTAPMVGDGSSLAQAEALLWEAQQLEPQQEWIAALSRARVEQDRRALRIALPDLRWQWLEDAVLQLEFSLPSGSYATAVLHELGTAVESDATLEQDVERTGPAVAGQS